MWLNHSSFIQQFKFKTRDSMKCVLFTFPIYQIRLAGEPKTQDKENKFICAGVYLELS